MSAFYLVIYIYAGGLARGDSVALVSVPQPTLAACQVSGEAAKSLVASSAKEMRFICVKASV